MRASRSTNSNDTACTRGVEDAAPYKPKNDKKARLAGSLAFQTVKKVRNRQNQLTIYGGLFSAF